MATKATKKPAPGSSRMGTNPLDLLVPSSSGPAPALPEATPPARLAVEARPAPQDAPDSAPSSAPSSRGPSKQRATFHLPTELIEQARDAVVALSGPPVRLTLAEFAEQAFLRELERLRKQHNQGKPFPRFGEPLRGGRPIGR